MRRIIGWIAMCFGAASCLAGAEPAALALNADERAWLAAHPEITFCFNDHFPPYIYADGDKGQAGYLPDLFSRLSKQLGVPLQLRVHPWDKAIAEARARRCDGLAMVRDLPVWRPDFLYSEQLQDTYTYIFTRSDDHRPLRRVNDLLGRKVAYQKGEAGPEDILQRYPGIKARPMHRVTDTLRALTNGEVDAILGITAVEYQRQRDSNIAVRIALEIPESKAANVIAIRRDWPELQALINKALARLGEAEKRTLAQRWFGTPPMPEDTRPQLQLSGTEKDWLQRHPEVRVHLDNHAPYAFREPLPSGMAVDYLNSVARRLGLRIIYDTTLLDPDSAARELAGATPHHDLLLTARRTPENEARFALTSDYLFSPQVIFVRKDSPFVSSMEGLAGRLVATEQESGLAAEIHLDYPDVPVLETRDTTEALQAVAGGQAEAYIGSLSHAAYRIKELGLDNLVVIAPAPFAQHASAMAIRKDWPELASLLDKGLMAMTPDERNAISQKWGALEIRPQINTTIILWIVLFGGATLLLVIFWNRTLQHEVSQRRQAEHDLRREREKAQRYLDTVQTLILDLDAAGQVVMINRAGCAMLGYREEELLGRNWFATCVPQPQGSAHDLPRYLEIVAGQPAGDDYCESQILCRDGKIRLIAWHHSYIRDAQGRISGMLSSGEDITRRKKAELNLQVAAATFESQEAIFITDADANIIRVNRAFEEVTGYRADEVIGQNPRILRSGRHDAAFYAQMWQQLLTVGTWSGEIWERHKNGRIYPKHTTITAVKDAQGRTTRYVSIFSDISERKRIEAEIHNLAFYDALTGLPNRRLLMERLNHALTASERTRQFGALLFLDLDQFKALNDTLGHDYGDMLLSEVAQRIQLCVRSVDTVSRFGGDEFAILLEQVGKNEAEASTHVAVLAEKIRAVLATPYQLNEHIHHTSPSIGVSLFRGKEPMDEQIKRADIAMYQAKESGRNSVRFFNPELQQAVAARNQLETHLRQAIGNDEFQLHYQLQVDRERRPIGLEALIRWQHPEHGMIPPARFIPIAEESTLILDIGRWVIEAACRQLADWRDDPLLRHLNISINISYKQFKQPDFVEQIKGLIDTWQVDPTLLTLELTESVAMDDPDFVVAKMLALRHVLGVRLSLDDFGTGYSSLSYLKRLPLDQIKIDQSFVRDMQPGSSDALMVKTIIDLARNFGMDVIAEGVETEAHLELLQQYGCNEYQGYLFSKPLPPAALRTLLQG